MGLKEDKQFALLLKEQNHKELIKKLDSILQALGSSEAAEMDLTGIERAIKSIQVTSTPDNSVPTAIMALSDVIIKKIEAIQNIEQEWTFKVERDSDGFIDIVRATNKNND